MRKKIENWLAQGVSFAEMERRFQQGSITQTEWRFGGSAGAKQEAFYKRFGPRAYVARISKVRVAFGLNPYTLCYTTL